MASRRMIDPAFWMSESLASLSIEQRYLFIGLFSNADDQGRLRGHAVLIRNTIFPFDDISPATVDEYLDNLASIGAIQIYEACGKRLIQVLGWWEYQQPTFAKPSAWAAPDGWVDRLNYQASGNVRIRQNWGNMPDLPGKQPEKVPAQVPAQAPTQAPTPVETGTGTGTGTETGIGTATGTGAAKKPAAGTKNARARNKSPTTADLSFEKIYNRWANAFGDLKPGQAEIFGDYFDDADCQNDWIAQAVDETIAHGPEKPYPYFRKIINSWVASGGPPAANPGDLNANGQNIESDPLEQHLSQPGVYRL